MLSTRTHNRICAGLLIGGFGLALAIAIVGNPTLTPGELMAARIAFGLLLIAFALLLADVVRIRRRRSSTVKQENSDHGI